MGFSYKKDQEWNSELVDKLVNDAIAYGTKQGRTGYVPEENVAKLQEELAGFKLKEFKSSIDTDFTKPDLINEMLKDTPLSEQGARLEQIKAKYPELVKVPPTNSEMVNGTGDPAQKEITIEDQIKALDTYMPGYKAPDSNTGE